ncbi:DNA-binding bromodomain-containing protein [Citrus sinensis]|nr:DNA-binding bromodomain-containing protein [Citrus sinensis]
MARERHGTTSQQQQQWGTLEELLLACAVNRHGTRSWDSIAMEVQNRSSALSSLTPQSCRDKFNEIRRRFTVKNGAESTSLVPLVDQLRQIRVQELRAEVKRLEEEREKSMKPEADLESDRKAMPEIEAAVDGDGDSNRSFNESNSTTQKAETTNKKQNDDAEGEEEKEQKMKPEPDVENDPVQNRTESGPDREDRDWSSNGKLNENGNGTGNVKEETDEDNDKTASEGKVESVKNKTSAVGGLSESNELWDESKREGKQSSDVQSSASLSRNKRRRSGEEPYDEEVSPATKKVLAVKSEPLVRFLGMIRSHRLSSHFERRLRSQESERYKKLVRQHIDLRTIQSRLDRGLYSNCFQKFFRDLLLLFNNFVIFFRKSSQEYAAAQELRTLVIKEMTDMLRKQQPIAVTKPKPKPKPEHHRQQPQPPPASLSKPNRGSTMVVCGKRSSIKAISKNAYGKKGDRKDREVEEKPKVNEKKVDSSFVGIEDKGIKKKRSQERSVSLRRNSRSSSRSGDVKHQFGGNELSSHDTLEAKTENKKENAVKKKKLGAASFLKRMKQNSPSEVMEDDDEEEDENDNDNDDDDSGDDSKDSKVEEEKKRRSVTRRDVNRVTRSSRGRGVREENRRRGVGRPPKRSASGAMSPPEKTSGKRGRDNGESEVGGGGRSRKRTRR